ncbi:MAG TPA: hypothetical protein VFA42_06140 [Gaiellaceae bacterium]|jgi:hypothetical protein|nr:hypothetical protein [Gaiellaceae bacterium]
MVRRAFVVAVVLAICAGTAQGASAPLPPSSALVLAPSDFTSGAAVAADSTRSADGRQIFVRLFRAGARFGSMPLTAVVSLALVEPDASTAQLDFGAFQLSAATKSGRQQLAREFGAEFVKGLKLGSGGRKAPKSEKFTVGLPVTVGAAGLFLPLSDKTTLGTFHISMVFADVDRVVSVSVLMAEPNVSLAPADSRAALTAIQKRLAAVFAVANTAAPTIAGGTTVGQTLTADAGTWTGAPSSFSYGWSRCDASGANCQAIAGATTSTYQVGTADSGSTLVVGVTGANSVGSASATSAATAVVSS